MGQKRNIRELNRILLRIRKCQEQMKQLPDGELSSYTTLFKSRLEKGETLEDLLPEAFAVICEADRRILGKNPYDAQILGAIALHKGYLAEMNTGEGKTLVATMPLYLNALTGKSTILLTTNEYLALRDAEEMGQVYRFMGMTVSVGVSVKPEQRFSNEDKKAIYGADIVYTTHGSFGFDYLLNNLVTDAEDRFLRELNYVIVDEADSVLLDAAQMPLVISGSPRVQSNLYEMADFFVRTLQEGRDYEKEEKMVWLTQAGVRYAERYFRIDNFYGSDFFEINRHVTLALRAHVLFEREKEYMITKDGSLQLLDGGSGRIMPGVKLRGGQHQALEVKENISLSRENRSVASITYQNLFLLFPKMAGMSGTLADAAEELQDVYRRKVIVIPPNRPVMRKDLPDIYIRDRGTQFASAIELASDIHSKGRPVLIVVSTIAETALASRMLMKRQIPHSVLNANNAFWEAEIIKEAGQMHAVTVATAMAGRGTDIRLGEGVRELGGLAVIGIGRMSNSRQERQARGRAGRQGDPGSSLFFVSLQDEVVQRVGVKNLEKYLEGKKSVGRHRLKKMINSAQTIGEELAVISRRQAMEYDQILKFQRNLIYETRDQLLDGKGMNRETVLKIAKDNIRAFLASQTRPDQKKVNRYVLDNLSYRLEDDLPSGAFSDKEALIHYLCGKVEKGLEEQEAHLGSEELLEDFMRIATLRAIDEAWIEQVDYLQQLRPAVTGRTSAQRNPVFEYQQEALESFRKMEQTILKNTVRNILLSSVYVDAEQEWQVLFP